MFHWNRYQWMWFIACLISAFLLVFRACERAYSSQELSSGEAPVVYGDSTVIATKGEVVLSNPFIQQLVYEWTSRCIGRPERPGLEWRVTEAMLNLTTNRWLLGAYFANLNGKRVVVLLRDEQYSPSTIIHESLHDILQLPDKHPDFEAARQRCETR